jgi:RNA polymerase primary sigma factor
MQDLSRDWSKPGEMEEVENSLAIYLRESCQHSVLKREEEGKLFAKIEEGKEIAQRAISQTSLECKSAIDDLDKAVSRLKSIAEDIAFLERLVSGAGSVKELTESQEIRLMKIARRKAIVQRSDLDFEDNELSQEQAMEIARKSLLELRSKIGFINGDLSSLVGNARRGMEMVNAAKEKIISSNLRLVISIAKRYRAENPAISPSDLVQEGNIGLMQAVDKFDYRKGHKFSTYAVWWIRQSISRSLDNYSGLIRLPVHVIESSRELKGYLAQEAQRLGRLPTLDEIADYTDIQYSRIHELLSMPRYAYSLEMPVGTDDSCLGDLIENEEIESSEDIVARKESMERITEALSSLSEREAQIIRMRYGLDDGIPRTLKEIGLKYGISRERARQLQNHALKRLRHPALAQKLKDAI